MRWAGGSGEEDEGRRDERDLADDGYSSLADSIVRLLCGVCGSETARLSSPLKSAGIFSQAVSQSGSQSASERFRGLAYKQADAWTPAPGGIQGIYAEELGGSVPSQSQPGNPTWQPAKLLLMPP